LAAGRVAHLCSNASTAEERGIVSIIILMVTVSGIGAKQTIVSQSKSRKSFVGTVPTASVFAATGGLSNRAAWKHGKIRGAACGEHASEPCNLVKLTLIEE
jgi:hypothetical protein